MPLCWSANGNASRIPRKKYEAPAPVIPMVSLTAEQIAQRKPAERAEAERVRNDMEAKANGRYEKQA